MEPILAAQIASCTILAIVFLQSALDKVTDYSGNLSWLKSHFEKTFLKNLVPMMLLTVTITELAAGALSAVGVVMLLVNGAKNFAIWGAELSLLALVMLIFGQRIAKDYAGASTLVIYAILCIAALALLS